MEWLCNFCNTDLLALVFPNLRMKNTFTSPIDLKRSAVMFDFPYNPVSPELRSFKRYQFSLARHRKLRDVPLSERVG
jgi:hypothetical protein